MVLSQKYNLTLKERIKVNITKPQSVSRIFLVEVLKTQGKHVNDIWFSLHFHSENYWLSKKECIFYSVVK